MPSAKEIRAHSGTLQIGKRTTDKLGFRGKTPADPLTFTITNWTSDVAMDCDTAVDAEICDVLGTLIKTLIDQGVIKGTVSA
jgi:hypothetical protein